MLLNHLLIHSHAEVPNLGLTEATRPSNEQENPAPSPTHRDSQIHVPDILQGLEDSRRSTPVLPPGLPIPAGVSSDLQRSSSPIQRPFQAITPAVPILPSTPLRPHPPPRVSEKAIDEQSQRDGSAQDPKKASTGLVQEMTKPQTHAHPAWDRAQKGDPKKQSAQESVSHPSVSDPTTVESTTEKSKEPKREGFSAPDDWPVIKGGEKAGRTPNDVPTVKPGGPETNLKGNSNKRQLPGKLDIPAAFQTYESPTPTQSTSTNVETPERASHAASATSASASRPQTPAATTDSPLRKAPVPRTLRVLSTPKAETPPSASALPPSFPTGKAISRQPSIVSMNRSGTPASEIVSELNSTTSASLSRANSPPPTGSTSKVGSAPIRAKTKSQLKKERQERAKTQEQANKTVEAAQISTVEDQAAAPLTGRKKKTKKEKQPKTATGKPTSVANQPPSLLHEEKSEAEKSYEVQSAAVDPIVKTEVPSEAVDELATTTPQPSQASPKREITPAGVFTDLQASGLTIRNLLEHFKPISSTIRHDITAADIAARDRPISLTKKDHAALAARNPLHLGGEDGRLWSRTFVAPSQKLLRALSREEEDRYVELEKRIIGDGAPTKFISQRKGSGGTEIQLPSVMDFLVASAVDVPPTPSIEGRDGNADDAMMYLNQMMPPMPPTAGSADSNNLEYLPSGASNTNILGSSPPRFDLTSARDLSGISGKLSTAANAGVVRSVQSPSVGVKEAESAWVDSRKKADRLERELNALIKRNRKLLTGTAH